MQILNKIQQQNSWRLTRKTAKVEAKEDWILDHIKCFSCYLLVLKERQICAGHAFVLLRYHLMTAEEQKGRGNEIMNSLVEQLVTLRRLGIIFYSL